MSSVVKKATPAAIAVLRQATALRPKRKKASDGLLPSAAHIKQIGRASCRERVSSPV